VPDLLLKQQLPGAIFGVLRINRMPPIHVEAWNRIADRERDSTHPVSIAIIGKYTGVYFDVFDVFMMCVF